MNPWQLCFFRELTTEVERVQVRAKRKSLTPSSTNWHLTLRGKEPDDARSGNVFVCHPKCPVYR
jgi:hypothetical protein